MALVRNYLGGDILRGPADGVGALPRVEALREAKVSDLNVPLVIQQEVLCGANRNAIFF